MRHHNRNKRTSKKPPKEQSTRNPHAAQKQCLPADDPADLPSGCTNRLQKAIEPDIPDNRYLENIINNQVSGQKNQKKCRRHPPDGHRICFKAGRQIGPVQIIFQIIRIPLIQRITALFDNPLQFPFHSHRAAEHHIAVDGSGNVIVVPVTVIQLFQVCIHISPAGNQHRHVKNRIRLPPAAEPECPRHLLPVYGQFQFYRRTYFQLHPQKLRRLRIYHQVILCLRNRSFHRFTKSKTDTDFIHIVKFTPAFPKLLIVHTAAQNPVVADLFNEIVVLYGFILFIGNVF